MVQTWGVTLTGVTVSGEVCNNTIASFLSQLTITTDTLDGGNYKTCFAIEAT